MLKEGLRKSFDIGVSRKLRILQDAGFLKVRRDRVWMVYSVDWQTTNRYATSLAKLLRDSSISNEVLAQDKEKLKHAVRIGPGCRKG